MNPLFGRALGIFRSNAAAKPAGLETGRNTVPGVMPMQPQAKPTGLQTGMGMGAGGAMPMGGGDPLAMLRARIKRPGMMPMMQPPEMEPDQDESALRPERPGAGY